MVKVKCLLLSVGVALVGGYIYNWLHWVPPKPVLEDIIWKSGTNLTDETIYPFRISVPNRVLEDLKQRLSNAKLSPPLQGVNSDYGINTDQLREVIDHWANKYDWRKREKFLNSVPQFRTQIQGLNIHFVRVKPDPKLVGNKKVLPLLLMHGWPGSVREFYDVFPLLTTPRKEYDFVFEVIAPSLPGYGFSDAATLPGMNVAQMAKIMKILMNRLGFEKFYVQGGDWGAYIGSTMATLYPENVLGLHSNMCYLLFDSPLTIMKLLLGSFYPSLVVDKEYEAKLYPLSNFFYLLASGSGYFHLQATLPDTLGVGITDSPTGLAGYVLDKFSWSVKVKWPEGRDDKITDLFDGKFAIDDLLDNLMIYWTTNTITSSMRLYAESWSPEFRSMRLGRIPTYVPTVCAYYPREIVFSPESLVKYKFKNLIHSSHLPRGGHFAALEEPELFSDDLWKGYCFIQNRINGKQQPC